MQEPRYRRSTFWPKCAQTAGEAHWKQQLSAACEAGSAAKAVGIVQRVLRRKCQRCSTKVAAHLAESDQMNDSNKAGAPTEYVLGMTRDAGRLAVRCSIDNREEIHPLTILATMESMRGDAKAGGETDLGSWRPVAASEWLAGLGVNAPSEGIDQLAWRGTLVSTEVVVPALALMQALLRPMTYVLVNMFAPQALDGICKVVEGKPVPNVSWRGIREKADTAGFVGPMTWMHCFPAARRMAASIYEYACEGVLGWDLAPARLVASMHGRRRGDVLYVTKVFVSEIQTDETPFEFASGIGQRFPTRSWEQLWPEARQMPLRDGSHSLSDKEWAAVEHLIPHRVSKTRKYSHRAVIDEILLNLCPGSTTGTSGQVPRASVRGYRQVWRERGQWDVVEATVREMRVASDGAPLRGDVLLRKRVRHGTRQSEAEAACGLRLSHYGPFEDREWMELTKFVQVKNGPTRRSSREVWDAILKGIGDGVRWNTSDKLERVAGTRYTQLQKRGRWESIARLLNELRPAADS